MVRIVLADEISPDCCRLWDIKTQDKLDKDRFRRDLGGLVEAYQEVARRLGIMNQRARTRPTGPGSSSSDVKHETGKQQGRPEEGRLDPQGKAIAGAVSDRGLCRYRRHAQGEISRSAGRDRSKARCRRGGEAGVRQAHRQGNGDSRLMKSRSNHAKTRSGAGPKPIFKAMCGKLLANTVIETTSRSR